MSANNQTLVKEHKGKWYIFANVNAEAWDEGEHTLHVKGASAVCDTRDEAFEKAWEVDEAWDGTEYGVQFNRLCKDDTPVTIVDDPTKEERP